jgi:signal transduction histidine kinase
MKLQNVPCDLVALIRAVLAITPPLQAKRKIAFNAVDSCPMVLADAGLIRRVVQNLLGNALKHTPAGGEVRIVITPSNEEVRVEVTDTGPGIASEFQQRIFEKFSQLEDGNNHLGTGLGLTFCKLAVEAHGGGIGVESEVGKGSTFWFVLPLLK